MKARQWKIEKKDMEKESVRKKALSETPKCHQETFCAGEEGSLKECLRGDTRPSQRGSLGGGV